VGGRGLARVRPGCAYDRAVPTIASHEAALAAAERVAAALAPGAVQRDRDGADSVPSDAVTALDTSGLLGITVPAAFGGPALGPATLAEVTRIIAAVDPAIAQLPQAHYLVVDVLAVHGDAALRERLFADVLAGRRIGNALAERGGRHAQDLSTRLKDGLLTGRKYYCTGALTAAWIAVSALDADGRVVLAFVPRDAPGVTVDTDWNVMGQRATISGTTTFEDVPAGLLLDYAGVFEVPQQLGARAQLVHAAIEAGIAEGALRDARAYLREKARPSTEAVRAGAASAADDPHVLHRYGRAATRVRAATALLRDAAAVLEDVGHAPADAQAAGRGSLAVPAANAQ
jgi:alkylation response protein AidB-like acyl-CoA dehydrogenase